MALLDGLRRLRVPPPLAGSLRALVPKWDALIDDFNAATGAGSLVIAAAGVDCPQVEHAVDLCALLAAAFGLDVQAGKEAALRVVELLTALLTRIEAGPRSASIRSKSERRRGRSR